MMESRSMQKMNENWGTTTMFEAHGTSQDYKDDIA
jgi:hypothetical protein